MSPKRSRFGTGKYFVCLHQGFPTELTNTRPVLDGQRVPPEALHQHRQTHHFLGPGCLCSSQSLNEDFSESFMFMVMTGQFKGQWAAACAKRVCKYWGKLPFTCCQGHADPSTSVFK